MGTNNNKKGKSQSNRNSSNSNLTTIDKSVQLFLAFRNKCANASDVDSLYLRFCNCEKKLAGLASTWTELNTKFMNRGSVA